MRATSIVFSGRNYIYNLFGNDEDNIVFIFGNAMMKYLPILAFTIYKPIGIPIYANF